MKSIKVEEEQMKRLESNIQITLALKAKEEKMKGLESKHQITLVLRALVAIVCLFALSAPAWGKENAQESDAAALAKKLSNPISALISLPVQFNWDENYGPLEEGSKSFINVQPVIPISLNETWNLISRTILPLAIEQRDLAPGSGSQNGRGDIVQSLFFSPQEPTSGGLIWGVGPVLLFPTATDDLLGGEKWGIGPTGVLLKQTGPWTYGALFNHVWSFAGEDDRDDIDLTFLQPFVSYTTPKAWTIALNAESTYNWETEVWAVPVNLMVKKVIRLGKQPVSVVAGVRYWADSPDNGADGWGVRLEVNFLFPK